MVTATTDDPGASDVETDDHETPPPTFVLDRNPRLALYVFIAVEVLAAAVFLWAGRRRWFFHDEWGFLIDVDGGDVGGLLRPDNEHWTTLPKIEYRLLFNIFGLNTYVPYQLVTISLHLAAAALLRVVMRRANVSAWMATLVACVFVLFGSGDHNILRGFQVTFTGAVAFGLIQLLLADHDGKIDRRDWFGLLAGVAALMCSGVGLAMVAAVALCALIRRGWRAAAFHSLPLVAVYLTWWLVYAREDYESTAAPLRKVASFGWASVTATFDALGQFHVVGLLLGVLLIVGLIVALRKPFDPGVRRRAAASIGLLFGALVFVLLTAWSRAPKGAGFANQSRYIHVIAALCLPALALGLDAIVRRWPVLVPAVVAVLLIGVPGNVVVTWNQEGRGRGERSDREVYVAFARVPAAESAPDWVRPDPNSAGSLTLGWLRQAIALGRLPDPQNIDPVVADEATFRLALQQVPPPLKLEGCEPLTKPTTLHLDAGQYFGFTGSILVFETNKAPTREERILLKFDGGRRSALQAAIGPLDLTIRPEKGGPPSEVCEIRRPR
jgi:hypothetical protein